MKLVRLCCMLLHSNTMESKLQFLFGTLVLLQTTLFQINSYIALMKGQLSKYQLLSMEFSISLSTSVDKIK